ncbi:PASTA domain-containing protein [Lactobacillus sp. PV037]|uniref:penicillin-binding transpeptidase domain-containing protein n=1 Tax=unclassified Lactobacillus TaxID=2620435 RepID=UPI00223FC0B7|nr:MULTISPECIES: penicillin-binding transpeptidase domain-containing protein [unclassified Lactobacillus]QNQ82463.1 PASTA domain-containing protein [Lactobacillus sp. PV012]QNQ83423.1 PASTA domain-containing protein [Lactobacillus sp. PV037]
MKKFNNFKRNISKAHNYRFTVGRILQLGLALVFIVFISRLFYLGLSHKVAGKDIATRVKELYQRNEVLNATRGSIYDRNGLTIAEDSHQFTIYAILDKSSIDYKNKPMYVINKRETAQKLATVLPLSEDKIYKYLTPKNKAYQVEFGTAGSGLSLSQKKKIEAMKLPGIKFVETPSRLYPNGVFASHIVGLVTPKSNSKTTSSTNLVGTMGIEQYFNKQLSGKDGYRKALVDADQYQLPNSEHLYKAAEDGDNIYLTLDSQLQTYLESVMTKVQDEYDPKSMTAVVEDIKTGQILAASQRPTFDPQTKKGLNSNWRNILVQDAYEPGSVFKILTYAAAIQSNNYNPNSYYKSGSIKVQDATIHDWNNSGWGTIPMSQALPRSSNVGFTILEQKMGLKTFKSYVNKFQIGKKTGVTLPGENPGLVSLTTRLQGAVTSFGQGVNVNAMQMMQAFSSVANDGQMIKPQFVEKITNSNGKTISEFHTKKVGEPIFSAATAQTILSSMQDVVNKNYGTGTAYKIPGKNVAVKTGTAQIAAPNGGYLKGDKNYLFSVVGFAPANNPRYCVYITVKQPRQMKSAETILASIFKPVMERVLNSSSAQLKSVNEAIEVPALSGKKATAAKQEAQNSGFEAYIIGSGKKVLRQSLPYQTKTFLNSKLFLYTGGIIKIPDMQGWSKAEVEEFSKVIGIPIKISGSGHVTKQSLAVGERLKANRKLSVDLT